MEAHMTEKNYDRLIRWLFDAGHHHAAESFNKLLEENTALMGAAEIAYSEMAFAVQDIADPRRREDDLSWSEMRGAKLAKAADLLYSILSSTKGGVNV
jgi:hypothetical protein